MYPQIELKRGKKEATDRRHPWIFSGAIARRSPDVEEGGLVDVYSDGLFVARGYYESGSIAVRLLTYDSSEVIDQDFWVHRFQAAYEMRQALGLVSMDSTYRLVHGEGDFVPGLIVDVYGDTVVMQSHTLGIHRHRQEIAQALALVLRDHCVYYKSETTLPFRSEDDERSGLLVGQKDLSEVTCQENGIRFFPDILKGQKTGFFIDQRDNRALLERYGKGRKVLNMFCYTGGFSLYALRGKATSVVSVDSSAKAMDKLEQNLRLNFEESDIAHRHQSLIVDAFKYLGDLEEGAYDLIVLDPPAFAKHRGVLHNALQGYRRINAEALQKIASGGLLFTFSCSQAVTALQFRQAVFTASLIAGRKIRILHTLTQPCDHPISIYHPEGEYLKGLVLYVE